jgi:DNA repair photolyase
MTTILPTQRLRTRGAASNAPGRFEGRLVEAVDDGWDVAEDALLVRTEVRLERPRSAITRNVSPDLPFDRSVNPYRGCEHGCIYCYARPSHAFLNLSPGLDFETRLIARPGIDRVLAAEISRPGYTVAPIALGTNTDPYQPVESEHGLTRAVLNVLADHGHPVTITTRGTLIERDLDILGPMAAAGLVAVSVSVTTLDADLARAMEPRAPAPARRIATIARLASAGIPVGVNASPLIPALTDHELEAILAAAAKAGAITGSTIPLRLPREVSGLFQDWITRIVPDRASRIMGRVRDLHGGRDYDPDFGTRMTGQGVWADLIRSRKVIALRRYGLDRGFPPLRCDRFRVPAGATAQLSFDL